MAKRKSFELWDEPEEVQEESDESQADAWEAPAGRRATPSSGQDDWDEDDASDGDDDWLDDTLDDLESEMQGCDEGEVYRLLGKPGRRGRDD